MNKWQPGRHLLLAGGLSSAMLLWQPAIANTEAADDTDESTVVYPAEHFESYNPTTAKDMIDRIPGVSLDGGGGGRGMGTGGNLLIDGQRVAGKDNSPDDQLTRISADDVQRVEIIRGTSGELDVRGSGQVVNVVLLDAFSRSSTSVEVNADRHQDGQLQPGGSLSHSRQMGNFQALINLEAEPQYEHRIRRETAVDPTGEVIDTTRETNTRDRTDYEMSSNMAYGRGFHRIQFNALYGGASYPREVRRDIDVLSGGTPVSEDELERTGYERSDWEVGGDYEYGGFADNGRFQLMFVVNDQTRDNVRERFLVEDARHDNDGDKTLFIDSDRRTRERIAQSSYSWSLNSMQDLELGLERAHTILDSSLAIGSAGADGAPSAQYGGLPARESISNPGTTVQEMRYEGFAVHNWTLNDRMTLESTLLYEASEIEQSGQVTQARSFGFLRPSLDYRFDITNSLQLRATAERQVSQLSFSNFAATANVSDRERDADAGNPDLVPEKEMRYELTLEYRLPEDNGVLSSRFVMSDIEDYIGRIDASTGPDQPISATGNVGDAQRWGVYLDASTRLSYLGLPNALLSSSVNLFDSRITDPFLGTEERINGRGRARMELRHDVTSLGLNYGITYYHPFNGGEYDIDVATIEQDLYGKGLNMFVSKIAFDDVTFRLESRNMLDREECRERLRFDGSTADGIVREIEDSCSREGPRLAFKVRTTF